MISVRVMSQRFSTTFLLAAVAATTLLIVTAPSDSGRTPLDLPVAHAGNVIEFFGADYAGDSFVWCLDRSCSMGWNGALAGVQAEARPWECSGPPERPVP